MGYATILLAAIVIASLNAILLLGAAGQDRGAPPGLLGGLVLTLDISLVASSLLLGLEFARRKRRILSALFFGNVALFIVAVVLRASGLTIRPAALFAADLYRLNLDLIATTRHWRRIIGPHASAAGDAPPEQPPHGGAVHTSD
jgi:hypothetical protein